MYHYKTFQEFKASNPENFLFTEKEFPGFKATLVTPDHIGCKWSKDTLCFRSSIWDSETGQLISAGFPKFFNLMEQPDITPYPKPGEKVYFPEKLDGSTLIVSRYKGHTFFRTRGQFNADAMPNAHEIALFREKHKVFFDEIESEDTFNSSWLFEWVSDANQVVVKYQRPEIFLIGMIRHQDYSMVSQSALNIVAASYGLNRPRNFEFASFTDALEYTKSHSALFDLGIRDSIFEGWVMTYGDGQYMRKIKTEKYLAAHKFKEKCDFETVLDFAIANDAFDFAHLFRVVEENFDYECASMALSEISRIAGAHKEVTDILDHMKKLCEEIKSAPRKEAAMRISQAYGNTGRTSVAFMMLDGKPIPAELIKKLYFQVTKK